MAWKTPKKAIEENPISAQEVKQLAMPELPSYEETVKMAATKKPIKEAEEPTERYELMEIPIQKEIVIKDNASNTYISSQQALCRILNILEGGEE